MAIAANISKQQVAWIGNSGNLRISIAGINNFMHIGRLHVRDSTTFLYLLSYSEWFRLFQVHTCRSELNEFRGFSGVKQHHESVSAHGDSKHFSANFWHFQGKT